MNRKVDTKALGMIPREGVKEPMQTGVDCNNGLPLHGIWLQSEEGSSASCAQPVEAPGPDDEWLKFHGLRARSSPKRRTKGHLCICKRKNKKKRRLLARCRKSQADQPFASYASAIKFNLTNFYEPQFGSRIKGACSLLKPARSTREATEA